MKWRTDKPTADVIVALVRFDEENMIGYKITEYHFRALERFADDFYVDYYADAEHISNDRIIKWADLEEDETVTDYKELEEEIDRAIDDLEGVAEKSSDGELLAHLTPIKHLKNFARHFYKLGVKARKNKKKNEDM